ncbi:hypothetical protein EIN_340650 [Entamoeba invadens IP1]|uniref:Uncharacterized protein n=1 Tax=Entamoeba invadens IP1 TaxID=370355 RepID=A0A0A1UE14_ENTIV|nr:hypothetical protein EIN_340650 [Entamoeba invadens IP1]ELP94727.1 hypothetical protein EIN_340650 [Entamoeba invadens IP1]|eukprot:XP_004261498.1 hypothetical protein EIN_340650 [Entamoeba invadens IP1]
MGNTQTPRVYNEYQSPSYKDVLKTCLATFPMTTINNLYLSNVLFGQIPKPFTQRIFSLFPTNIPFQMVVALVYIFMVSPRHTRAVFITDLYLGSTRKLSQDQINRFFYDLTVETNSNVDLIKILHDFRITISPLGCTDTDIINYLTTQLTVTHYTNCQIFTWICEGGKMPRAGHPLIDPERTINDLLLIWNVRKPADKNETKISKISTTIVSSYSTEESVCQFNERSIKQLTQIYYALRPLKFSEKGVSVDLIMMLLSPTIKKAILVPLTQLITTKGLHDNYKTFFIALAFTCKDTTDEKFKFIREVLNPPVIGTSVELKSDLKSELQVTQTLQKKTVDLNFVMPFIDAFCTFSSTIKESIGDDREPTDAKESVKDFILRLVSKLGEYFAYTDFENSMKGDAGINMEIEQMSQAMSVLHGGLPKKIETEAQVFKIYINMYDVAKMRAGERVVVIPANWFSKWMIMLNSKTREPLGRIDFTSIVDEKIPMALKESVKESDVVALHPEVFSAIDTWYKHEGAFIERRLYLDEENKVKVELFPLRLQAFSHLKGALTIPVRNLNAYAAYNDFIVISKYASLVELHKALCIRFKVPFNKARILMFDANKTPLIVQLGEGMLVKEYFKDLDFVCLQSVSVKLEAQNVDTETPIGVSGGEVGFYNEGNTCYINSVIQVLAHTPLFALYFLSNEVKKDLINGPLYSVGLGFSNLLYKMWKPTREPTVISMSQYRETMINATSKFNDKEQHDAMEYLCYMLLYLHDSVNRRRNPNYIEMHSQQLQREKQQNQRVADSAEHQKMLNENHSQVSENTTTKTNEELKDKSSKDSTGAKEAEDIIAKDLVAGVLKEQPNDDQRPLQSPLESPPNKEEVIKERLKERMDEEKSWNDFTEVNESIISETTTVMLKNEICCSVCQTKKVNFEPTNALSIPLTSEMYRTVEFIVVGMDGQLPIKYSLRLPPETLLKEVKAQIATLSGVQTTHLVFTDAPGGVVKDILKDSMSMRELPKTVKVFEVERVNTVNPQEKCINSVVTKRVKKNAGNLFGTEMEEVTIPSSSLTPLIDADNERDPDGVVIVNCINRISSENAVYFVHKFTGRVVSVPFLLTLSYKDLTVKNIEKVILRHLRLAMRKVNEKTETQKGDETTSQVPQRGNEDTSQITQLDSFCVEDMKEEELPFDLHVTSYDGKNCYLCSWEKGCIGCKLTQDILDKYDFSKFTFTVCIDWKKDNTIRYDQSIADVMLRDPSVERNRQIERLPIDIKDCFALFTSPEELGIENGWFCPHCKAMQVAKKRIVIDSLPIYLIVHLNRFTEVAGSWSKRMTDVKYPLKGFSIQKYLDSSVKCDENDVYDLFGVINHNGTLVAGHYTAMCTSQDGRWLKFDDKTVSQIHENAVVNENAYILFYMRRNADVGEVMRKFNFNANMDLLNQSCVIV